MLFLLGCASTLDMGRATVLEPGQDRWSVMSEGALLTPELVERTPTSLPWLNVGFGYHRGVVPRLELGVRGWGFGWPRVFTNVGIAADAKWQLKVGPGPVLAIGAALGYARPAFGTEPWHIGTLDVPLFVGFDIGESQLVLSPRLGAYTWGSYGQVPGATVSGGLGVGWAIQAGPLDIMPEAVFRWAPVGFNGAFADSAQLGMGGVELGCGVSW